MTTVLICLLAGSNVLLAIATHRLARELEAHLQWHIKVLERDNA